MKAARPTPRRLAIEPSLRNIPRIEEFLQVIVANPEDDTARLVLSDYLTDHGLEERAELIRIQCRMYRLEEEDQEIGAEYGRLERRSDAILAQHGDEWKPLPELANCLFHRGLLETYRLENVNVFLGIAARVFEGTTVQVLRVRTPEDVQGVFVLPGLDRLYELDLPASGLSEEGVRLLASRPWLAGIRELNLDSNSLHLESFQTLASSCALNQLRILSLRHSWLSNEEIATLSCARWFKGLVRLDLAGQGLTLEGIRRMTSVMSPSLAWLDLASQPLGDALAGVLAQASSLSSLKALLLRHCGIGPGGAWTLAQSPSLRSLERLSLSSNRVGAEGTQAILESRQLTCLVELDLDGNSLFDQGAHILANSTGTNRLLRLDLQRNAIGDAGAGWLADSPHLKQLTQLVLDRNQITNAGAQVLGTSSALPALQLLSLECNRIGDAGTLALLHSPLAARGVEIRLDHNPISPRVRRQLRDRATIRRED